MQLHGVVRWAVPPVGDRLLVARGDVRQVLKEHGKVRSISSAPIVSVHSFFSRWTESCRNSKFEPFPSRVLVGGAKKGVLSSVVSC